VAKNLSIRCRRCLVGGITWVLNGFDLAHDVANLFVVDRSSFVTLDRFMPTLTTAALAARGSDTLSISRSEAHRSTKRRLLRARSS